MDQIVFDTTGSQTWTVPSDVYSVHVLVVGGGGAGHSDEGSGGGGAGGCVMDATYSVTPGDSISVIVGNGGTTAGANGEDSVFGTLVAKGGGGGGGNGGAGKDGGSGGGAGQSGITGGSATQPGTNGSVIFDDGCDGGGSDPNNGSGGGGANDPGANGGPDGSLCNGGIGVEVEEYFGISVGDFGWVCGGGAGGNNETGEDNYGGSGGGGASPGTDNPEDGVATSGGGGGGRSCTSGCSGFGAGGSGTVVIKPTTSVPITMAQIRFQGLHLPEEKRVPCANLSVKGSAPKLNFISVPAANIALSGLSFKLDWQQSIPQAKIAILSKNPDCVVFLKAPKSSTDIPTSSLYPLRPRSYWTADPTRVQTIYVFVLTGSTDGETDIQIPISSCQMRRRNGKPTYMSVVVSGYDAYADAILARPNGEMVLYKGVRFADGSQQTQEIARVDMELENLRMDKGPKSRSISLVGHRTVETLDPNVIKLSGASYRNYSGGLRRFRCEVDLWLQPGDIAEVAGESIEVGNISYTIGTAQEVMEIEEAES